MQPHDLDDELDVNEEYAPQEINTSLSSIENREVADKYLKKIEADLFADIDTREKVDNFLLFMWCQLTSTSLAWILFELQMSLLLINLCALIALLPGVIHLTNDFNVVLTKENWQVILGKSPLLALFKIGVGWGVSMAGTKKINDAHITTRAGIEQTYIEIKVLEKNRGFLDNWTMPSGLNAILLVSAIGITIFTLLNRKNKSQDNQNEKDV
jgi:hypothetical protein